MLVTVPSFAKLNLDLRVLSKRPADGYHELRTIFQTISLHDSLTIEFTRAKRTEIELDSSVEIADNLVLRAAKLVLDHLKLNAHIRFQLRKQIPMGAGMGGGSSNAAATLIALPALAGKPIPFRELATLAETLGSDVNFFLHGGTALGLGRGTELYPLPDLPRLHAVVVYAGIHVSTAEAYKALGRSVADAASAETESTTLREFQEITWSLDKVFLEQLPLKNDFEAAVFARQPELKAVVGKLRKLGANPAMMTGSGSAVFGVFGNDGPKARKAAAAFAPRQAFALRFLDRHQYHSLWQRALGPAADASCFGEGVGRQKA